MEKMKTMDSKMKTMDSMKGSYRSLGVELIVDFIIMYLVMYTMIASLNHFYFNLNNVYMTLMMVAPMVVAMILAMRHMFPSKGANAVLLAGSVVVFLGNFALIRTQTTIGDTAFLRSMIPHHAGAILMCGRAPVKDPEIRSLCATIIKGQQQEIDQMSAMLAPLR